MFVLNRWCSVGGRQQVQCSSYCVGCEHSIF